MNSAMSERNVYYFLVHFRTPSFLLSTMFVFNLILIAIVIIIKKHVIAVIYLVST